MSDDRPLEWQQVDGVLLLDKKVSMSSNAALQITKRLFRAKRAGHTGTLDPMAEGLLVICFGHATKFSGEMLAESKSYLAEITLGVRTTTADREGSVLSESDYPVDEELITRVVHSFKGEIKQVPPMYSALKKSGVPLYRYARDGIDVPREARAVTIYQIGLLRLEPPLVEISVTCSKGTYIRSLAEDIGTALGCGAYLSKLIRTDLGAFKLKDSQSIQQIEQLDQFQRQLLLRPIDSLLARYPEIELGEEESRRFCLGQGITVSTVPEGVTRVYGPNTRFLGLAEANSEGLVQPKRVIN
jgi:tRNA pseudouridine55 synthase